MATYKVLSPVQHGAENDEGDNEVKDYAKGSEIELSEEEAKPLLASGAITADDSNLSKSAGEVGKLQEEIEELRARLNAAQQESKDLSSPAALDPTREHGTMVANPEAAPFKPAEGGDDYNTYSRAELQSEARDRGLSAGGTKGDLVNRLNADDQQREGATTAGHTGQGESPEDPGQ